MLNSKSRTRHSVCGQVRRRRFLPVLYAYGRGRRSPHLQGEVAPGLKQGDRIPQMLYPKPFTLNPKPSGAVPSDATWPAKVEIESCCRLDICIEQVLPLVSPCAHTVHT